MPRIRPATAVAIHDTIGAATGAWTPAAPADALARYAVKQGVFHALAAGRTGAAKARMTDLHFMAAFAASWPTVVEPLSAWRSVGAAAEGPDGSIWIGGVAAASSPWIPTGAAVARVAEWCRDAGWLAAGVALARWWADHAAALHGTGTPQHLDAQTALGGALAGVGRSDEAFPLLEGVLVARREAVGSHDRTTLQAAAELAVAYLGEGRPREALPLLETDLEASMAAHGADHPDVWNAHHNLGAAHRQLGDLAQSAHHYGLALQGRTDGLGTDHIATLNTVANLGVVAKHQGEGERAEALYRRAIAGRTSALGSNHPSTVIAVHNLAVLLRSAERYEDALALYDRCATCAERAYGPDHPFSLTVRRNRAMVLKSMGRHRDAVAALRAVLSAERARWGDDHPDALTTAYKLATTLTWIDEHSEATALLRFVAAARLWTLGAGHAETAVAHSSLADLLDEGDEALEARRQAVIAYQESRGMTHRRTLAEQYQLAKDLMGAEQWGAAVSVLDAVCAGQEAVFGADHPRLAMTHWNLARGHRRLDRPADAARHRRRCWAIECADDGPAASGTLQTAHALVRDLLAADRPDEARAVARDALDAAASATDADDDRAEWVAKLTDLQG